MNDQVTKLLSLVAQKGKVDLNYNEMIKIISAVAQTFPELDYSKSQNFRQLPIKELQKIVGLIIGKLQNYQYSQNSNRFNKFNEQNKEILDEQFTKRMTPFIEQNRTNMLTSLPSQLGFGSDKASFNQKLSRAIQRLNLQKNIVYDNQKKRIVDVSQRGKGYQPKEVTSASLSRYVKNAIQNNQYGLDQTVYLTDEYKFLQGVLKKLGAQKRDINLSRKMNKLYKKKTPKQIASKIFQRIKTIGKLPVENAKGTPSALKEIIKSKVIFSNNDANPMKKLLIKDDLKIIEAKGNEQQIAQNDKNIFNGVMQYSKYDSSAVQQLKKKELPQFQQQLLELLQKNVE